MILETILSKYNLDSFVKQYDAMLCYENENTFQTYNANEWIEFISTYQKGEFIGKQIDNNHNINGLTFMEVCDMDLFTHLFNIQQEKFPHITQFTDINNDFTNIDNFLSSMIKQILQPLSILHHSQYAFIHGDLKSKNIFVKINNGKYLYKLADYDKSSITFNGIRFYNKGPSVVENVRTYIGPKRFDDILFTNKYETLADIVKLDITDNEKINNMYSYILHKLNNNIDNELTNLQTNNKTLYDKLYKFLAIILNYWSKDKYFSSIKEIIQEFKTLNKTLTELNAFYTISNIITNLSKHFTKLKEVELEQFYVRYMPFPFFHTIDLYTLFLSLLQSPLVYMFIKYCMYNKDKVKNSLFWNSFYDLWISDNDIYAILGYFEYMFSNNLDNIIELMGRINFVLDPLKTNNILLLRKVNNTYWDRVWGKPMTRTPYKINSIALTNTFSMFYPPNIQLSEPGTFNGYLHYDKHKYYVNKGITISSPITLVDMYNFTGNTNNKYEVYYNQLANKIIKHAKNKILDINKIIVFLQMVYKMPANGSFDVLHNVCKTNIYYVFEGLGTSMYDWDYASTTDEHIQDIIDKMNVYYKN